MFVNMNYGCEYFQNKVMTVQASNYRKGGISHICFSNDAQAIITANHNGTATCWNWSFTTLGKSRVSAAIETFKSMNGLLKSVKNKEEEAMKKMREVKLEEGM